MPFPKPKDKEGKITLTPAERREKLNALCRAQDGRCAICGCRMTREPYQMNSATLEHKSPQPAGCAKRDNDDNLQAACWHCNIKKGSRR